MRSRLKKVILVLRSILIMLVTVIIITIQFFRHFFGFSLFFFVTFLCRFLSLALDLLLLGCNFFILNNITDFYDIRNCIVIQNVFTLLNAFFDECSGKMRLTMTLMYSWNKLCGDSSTCSEILHEIRTRSYQQKKSKNELKRTTIEM